MQYEEDTSVKLLRLFEEWQINKKNIWKQIGIHINKKYDSPYAVQHHMDVSSAVALGRVSYYESNGYFWVDFEALSLLNQPPFNEGNITFTGEISIEKTVSEFEEYIQGL